tara:strand:+ start:313 stop:684 length:372 start_codon:yes stop_codon:yes gene_type:complete
MKDKYKEYIEYIARDIQVPYLKSLNMYEIKQDDYHLVLSKVFNQPVDYGHGVCIDKRLNNIYNENSDGDWIKREYDNNGNETYYENSSGYCQKREYDSNGKIIYNEDNNGEMGDYRVVIIDNG